MRKIIVFILFSFSVLLLNAQTVFTVTNPNDCQPFALVPGTLRWACEQVNANPNVYCEIRFNIDNSVHGAPPHVINLTYGTLPSLYACKIDGTTEPDYNGTIPVVTIEGNNGAYQGIAFTQKLTANPMPAQVLALKILNVSGTGIFSHQHQLIVDKCVIDHAASVGVGAQYTSLIQVTNCSISSCNVGIRGKASSNIIVDNNYLYYANRGIDLDCASFTVTDNVIDNSNKALILIDYPSLPQIADRIIGSYDTSKVNRFVNCNFDIETYPANVKFIGNKFSGGNGGAVYIAGNSNYFFHNSFNETKTCFNILGRYNILKQNAIYGGLMAITLTNGGNDNKKAPLIMVANQFEINGKAEPGDTVELYESAGAEQANRYLATVVADANGQWTLPFTGALSYSGLVALARNTQNNTSPLSNYLPKTVLTCPSSPFKYSLNACSGNANLKPITLIWDELPSALYEMEFRLVGDSWSQYQLHEGYAFDSLLANGQSYEARTRVNCGNGLYSVWDTLAFAYNYTPIAFDAGADITMCQNSTAQLYATIFAGASYSWQPSVGLSHTDKPNPIINLDATTTYTLTVEYQGCTLIDSVTVTVKPQYMPECHDKHRDMCAYPFNTQPIPEGTEFIDSYGYPVEKRINNGDNGQQATASALLLTANDYLQCGKFKLYFADKIRRDHCSGPTQGFADETPVTDVTWASNLGEARRKCACEVFKYISEEVIDIPDNVTPDVLFKISNVENISDNWLGRAGQLYYNNLDNANCNRGTMESYIILGENLTGTSPDYDCTVSPNAITNIAQYDGNVIMNFGSIMGNSIEWHYNYQTAPIGYDLFSVILHEATHTLGFAACLHNNGASSVPFKYAKYASFVRNDNTFLINSCSSSTPNQAGMLTSNDARFSDQELSSSNCLIPIYAPTIWTDGSSISHIDSDFGQDCVMKPSISSNIPKRELTISDQHVLCEIGYQLYDNSGCEIVIGRNDYISIDFSDNGNIAQLVTYCLNFTNPCTFPNLCNNQECADISCTESSIAPSDPTSIIVKPTSNDYLNSQSFEIVSYSDGTVQYIYDETLKYTPSTNFIGVCDIQYRPIFNNIVGEIVHIFVKVTRQLSCPSPLCNLAICNGDLEHGPVNAGITYWAIDLGMVPKWTDYTGSTDYVRANVLGLFTYGVGNTSPCLESITENFQSHDPAMINTGITCGRWNEIGVLSISTIPANENYKLSFWYRMIKDPQAYTSSQVPIRAKLLSSSSSNIIVYDFVYDFNNNSDWQNFVSNISTQFSDIDKLMIYYYDVNTPLIDYCSLSYCIDDVKISKDLKSYSTHCNFPSNIVSGDNFTFTLSACNYGLTNVSNVSMSYELPSGINIISPLPAGCILNGNTIIVDINDIPPAESQDTPYCLDYEIQANPTSLVPQNTLLNVEGSIQSIGDLCGSENIVNSVCQFFISHCNLSVNKQVSHNNCDGEIEYKIIITNTNEPLQGFPNANYPWVSMEPSCTIIKLKDIFSNLNSFEIVNILINSGSLPEVFGFSYPCSPCTPTTPINLTDFFPIIRNLPPGFSVTFFVKAITNLSNGDIENCIEVNEVDQPFSLNLDSQLCVTFYEPRFENLATDYCGLEPFIFTAYPPGGQFTTSGDAQVSIFPQPDGTVIVQPLTPGAVHIRYSGTQTLSLCSYYIVEADVTIHGIVNLHFVPETLVVCSSPQQIQLGPYLQYMGIPGYTNYQFQWTSNSPNNFVSGATTSNPTILAATNLITVAPTPYAWFDVVITDPACLRTYTARIHVYNPRATGDYPHRYNRCYQLGSNNQSLTIQLDAGFSSSSGASGYQWTSLYSPAANSFTFINPAETTAANSQVQFNQTGTFAFRFSHNCPNGTISNNNDVIVLITILPYSADMCACVEDFSVKTLNLVNTSMSEMRNLLESIEPIGLEGNTYFSCSTTAEVSPQNSPYNFNIIGTLNAYFSILQNIPPCPTGTGLQNFTFKNCNFNFGSDGDINTQDGIFIGANSNQTLALNNSLSFSRCTLRTSPSCSTMWDGIYIANGQLTASLILITDAKIGVHLEPRSQLSMCLLELNQTTFDKNRVGIKFDMRNDEFTTANLYSGLDRCIFCCNTPPLQDIGVRRGIEIVNTNVFSISLTNNGNLFKNLYEGIFADNYDLLYSANLGLNVSKCRFQDIRDTAITVYCPKNLVSNSNVTNNYRINIGFSSPGNNPSNTFTNTSPSCSLSKAIVITKPKNTVYGHRPGNINIVKNNISGFYDCIKIDYAVDPFLTSLQSNINIKDNTLSYIRHGILCTDNYSLNSISVTKNSFQWSLPSTVSSFVAGIYMRNNSETVVDIGTSYVNNAFTDRGNTFSFDIPSNIPNIPNLYGILVWGNTNIRTSKYNIAYNTIPFDSDNNANSYGISVCNVRPFISDYQIFNNTISNALNAIFGLSLSIRNSNNQSSPLIRSNTINMIPTIPNGGTGYGITTYDCQDMRIVLNTINGANSIQGVPSYVGLYSMHPGSSSLFNIVMCNSIDKVGRCMTFSGVQSYTGLLGNKMKRGRDGIYLTNNAALGPQFFQWGNAITTFDNSWQNFGNTNLRLNGDIINGQGANTSFRFRNGTDAYNPSPYAAAWSGTDVMGVNSSNTSTIDEHCEMYLPAFGDAQPSAMALRRNKKTNLHKIVSDSLVYTQLTSSSKYLDKQLLYRALLNDDSLAYNDPVLAQVKDSLVLTNLGKFETINALMLASSPEAAYALNASIISQNEIETTQKAVNEMLIQMLLDSASLLSESQAIAMRPIANFCPHQFGKAVYQARALIAMYDGQIHSYIDDCLVKQTETRKANDNDLDNNFPYFSLYPNPANDKVTLSWEGLEDDNTTVVVNDITGKIIYEGKIFNESGKIEVATNNWTSGLYVFKFTIGGKNFSSKKLLIAR